MVWVVEALVCLLVTLLVVGTVTTLTGRPVKAGPGIVGVPAGTTMRVKGTDGLQRGDLVVVTPDSQWRGVTADRPGGPTRLLRWMRLAHRPASSQVVTRIVGMPGDEVRCCGSSGHLLVNSAEVPTVASQGHAFRVIIPADTYFVATDQPSAASSACYLATLADQALVTRQQVVGRVAAAGPPWARLDLAAAKGPYTGISPGQAPPPRAVIEAAKDPAC